ncbi:F0F1 ATP synthase subunit B [Helicobacter cappadocius]|uniref:ATP synthase subunit b n=1 Tax=Helicobacter cappadocius TaxID=3063998 RepID=A0AA90PQ20_9HELI|nr:MULTISPECIES: F0F1 ATP synthase subunit B [unclassified Helicobacter]MDO7252748.1 F0F1 ATP synthase subunit B [Helicobacter sp. faydin-H75]MDP2538616.1 F0F1 ATP synthase subunit B [Helicobacter sp. faydin-H76]
MKYILLFLLGSSMLFAADVNISQTDIVERTINFFIFLAILWYFVADKLKYIFTNRREQIVLRLNQTQEKLKIAKKAREEAIKRLDEAKERATDMVALAKKEAYLVSQKLDEQFKLDVENMIKNNEALMEFERKRMEKKVVEEILSRLFQTDASSFDVSKYVNILNKRVA